MCLFLTNYCPLERTINRKQVKIHTGILVFIIYDLGSSMWMSQHRIFGIEGKIDYFWLIFDQMLAKHTTSNSKANQNVCSYISFHHIWRYILIQNVSSRYEAPNLCFHDFGVTSVTFGLFSTNFWPCRPPYTWKEIKPHISTSVTIIYDLSE